MKDRTQLYKYFFQITKLTGKATKHCEGIWIHINAIIIYRINLQKRNNIMHICVTSHNNLELGKTMK